MLVNPALSATGAAFITLVGYQGPSNPTASANAVYVGGTCIMRVQVASGGFSTARRASAIQARVNQLLGSGPITPDDITVEPVGNEASVDVKGKLLFTADWATARYNHSTPNDLAKTWADNMRRVLPSLTQAK